MSDMFGLRLYRHVFTLEGDRTVIAKDRDAQGAFDNEMPLLRLLHDERGLLALSVDPGAEASA